MAVTAIASIYEPLGIVNLKPWHAVCRWSPLHSSGIPEVVVDGGDRISGAVRRYADGTGTPQP